MDGFKRNERRSARKQREIGGSGDGGGSRGGRGGGRGGGAGQRWRGRGSGSGRGRAGQPPGANRPNSGQQYGNQSTAHRPNSRRVGPSIRSNPRAPACPGQASAGATAEWQWSFDGGTLAGKLQLLYKSDGDWVKRMGVSVLHCVLRLLKFYWL